MEAEDDEDDVWDKKSLKHLKRKLQDPNLGGKSHQIQTRPTQSQNAQITL